MVCSSCAYGCGPQQRAQRQEQRCERQQGAFRARRAAQNEGGIRARQTRFREVQGLPESIAVLVGISTGAEVMDAQCVSRDRRSTRGATHARPFSQLTCTRLSVAPRDSSPLVGLRPSSLSSSFALSVLLGLHCACSCLGDVHRASLIRRRAAAKKVAPRTSQSLGRFNGQHSCPTHARHAAICPAPDRH